MYRRSSLRQEKNLPKNKLKKSHHQYLELILWHKGVVADLGHEQRGRADQTEQRRPPGLDRVLGNPQKMTAPEGTCVQVRVAAKSGPVSTFTSTPLTDTDGILTAKALLTFEPDYSVVQLRASFGDGQGGCSLLETRGPSRRTIIRLHPVVTDTLPIANASYPSFADGSAANHRWSNRRFLAVGGFISPLLEHV